MDQDQMNLQSELYAKGSQQALEQDSYTHEITYENVLSNQPTDVPLNSGRALLRERN